MLFTIYHYILVLQIPYTIHHHIIYHVRSTSYHLTAIDKVRQCHPFCCSAYPGSMYIFEPASVMGVLWKGVNLTLAGETDRINIFTEKVGIKGTEWWVSGVLKGRYQRS